MLENFQPKNAKDLLAINLKGLIESHSEQEFLFLIGAQLRGGKGKKYKNYDKLLPAEGNYQELEVNGPQDSRRIVIDFNNYSIYATRNHYQTMSYAGKPTWAD